MASRFPRSPSNPAFEGRAGQTGLSEVLLRAEKQEVREEERGLKEGRGGGMVLRMKIKVLYKFSHLSTHTGFHFRKCVCIHVSCHQSPFSSV